MALNTISFNRSFVELAEMNEETRIRNIRNIVEDEARQLLAVNQRTDYVDVRSHLYNVAWSQFDSESDDHEVYKDRVILAVKRIIDDWIIIAYDLTKQSMASNRSQPRESWRGKK